MRPNRLTLLLRVLFDWAHVLWISIRPGSGDDQQE